MVQSMLICMCMHMWYSSHTHILSSHAFWSTQSKISHSFPILAREFQIYRVAVFFSSSSSSLHIAIDIMMFSLPFFVCTARTHTHDGIVFKNKKQQTKEWANEWKISTAKIAYQDYWEGLNAHLFLFLNKKKSYVHTLWYLLDNNVI